MDSIITSKQTKHFHTANSPPYIIWILKEKKQQQFQLVQAFIIPNENHKNLHIFFFTI